MNLKRIVSIVLNTVIFGGILVVTVLIVMSLDTIIGG